MNRSFNPYLHLWAALLCVVAAVALRLNVSAYLPQASFQDNIEIVSAKVEEAVARAEADIRNIESYLSRDTLSFSGLQNRTFYPSFVVQKGKLVYWSDHTLEPDLSDAQQHRELWLVENKYGKFLVRHRRLKDQYGVYVYIPLEVQYSISNHYLSSGLNRQIFQKLRARITTDSSDSNASHIYDTRGRYLFSMQVLEQPRADRSGRAVAALLSLGILFLAAFLFLQSRRQFRKAEYLRGVMIFVLPLLLLRVLMLYTGFPFALADLPAFDPKLYAASSWSPSIGDLVLNSLLLAVIVWNLVYLFRKLGFESFLRETLQKHSGKVQIACAVVFYLLLVVLYRFYYNLFSNSLLVMDITQSIHFSVYRVLFYLSIVLRTGAFLGFSYILIRIFYAMGLPKLRPKLYVQVAALVVLLSAGSFLKGLPFFVLAIVFILFWTVVLAFGYIRSNSSIQYQTYLLVFLVLVVSAVTGSKALQRFYLNQLKVYKQQFASNLLTDHDLLGEYLLEDISGKIQQDVLLQRKLKEPFIDDSFIKQKISRYYLSDYFDKYETRVLIFDADGRLIGEPDTSLTLDEVRGQLLKKGVATEHPGLYLIGNGEQLSTRHYVKFIGIPVTVNQQATILLELHLKKLMPHSVVPELLVDQKYGQPLQFKSVSYAVYQQGMLHATEGEFDYVNQFEPHLLSQAQLFQNGITSHSYHHYAVHDKNGRVIVITTARYSLGDALSNFSFLFLLHALAFFLYMAVYVLLRGKLLEQFNTSFSTKIQLFLNFGILIPLVLVSIATAGLVTASYRKDLTVAYEKRGKMIQENLLHFYSESRRSGSRTSIAALVNEVSDLSEADINIYDRNGRLLATSQPLIFEAGLLSRRINPEAFAAIAEKRAPRILLTENAGSLSFNSLYLPVRSQENRQVLTGFIGIPFFDSEKELNQKLIELITTIMNIFTVMFILFMLLTFLAARALTVPLKLVTEKLKKITLTGKNEVLEYESDDEIGLLVHGYNQMLLKLEESKAELAMREKEAAWREMARQVAHEIKNPLTPMKLSLQYLQKAIAEKRPNTEELIGKISQTMITQIEILSDIATSFSNFTSMPEPKLERIDIAALLKTAVHLHHDPAKVTIHTNLPEEEVWVMADGNLMVRTFNNLLINALQAVPADRKPELRVMLQQLEDRVLISIQDNGSGIPDEIRHKVFIPNFSTKYSGSGIGLAVAKKGIESAGGRIWFETEENKGTTFYIELPLARE